MPYRPNGIPVSLRRAVLFRIAAVLSPFAALTLVVLVGATAPAAAEGPPKGIRAPDAWGAILPAPPESEPSVWEVFFDHDGRLVIRYSYIVDFAPSSQLWIGRLYDLGVRRLIAETAIPVREIEEGRKEKGRQWEASIARMRAEKAFRYWISSRPTKLLSEEARLEVTEPFPLWEPYALVYTNWGLRKTDSAGNELFNVSIFFSPKDDSKQRFPRGPWLEEGPDAVFTRTRALFPNRVYDLKDGTYLLTASDEPVVIRYHGNLQSPFLDANDELLVLDLAQAKPMIIELIERAEAVAGRRHSRAEEFWDAFEALLTERIRAMIAAKRKKN